MSPFIRVSPERTIPEIPSGKSIRVSVDCIAALMNEGEQTFQAFFKQGILPDFFYKHKFLAYITDRNKQAAMGLTG